MTKNLKFMNRILLSLLFALGAATSGFAQLQFNPQIGVNFTDVKVDLDDLVGIDPKTQSKAGVLVGADLRIGEQFYIQPGLFVIGSKIVYEFDTDEYEITRYGAKLKGLLGYKLIDDAFRLRVMAGPTYDFKLGINSEDNPYFDEDDFKNGIFNLDAAIGIDVVFLSAEVGYSWAFTETFDQDFFDNKPRYETIYFTLGLVFGE
jgi:hypothetical protein